MKLYKKYIYGFFILIIILISLCLFYRNSQVVAKINNFLLNEMPKNKFKDLLSVLLTIFAVFVGFMATIGTLFIGLTEKRTIKFINAFNKGDLLIATIKTCIYSGIGSVLIMAVMYIMVDVVFNIMIIQSVTIILVGVLYVFISSSVSLLILINITLKDVFQTDEDFVIKARPKKMKK